jgi:integrase
MRWTHLDLDRAVWTIPASLAKNGRAHEVPLSSAALAIIASVPRFAGSDLVFTTTGTTPITGFGRVKGRMDLAMGISDWRIHDLRRTAASGMARIGVADKITKTVDQLEVFPLWNSNAVHQRQVFFSSLASKVWDVQPAVESQTP